MYSGYFAMGLGLDPLGLGEGDPTITIKNGWALYPRKTTGDMIKWGLTNKKNDAFSVLRKGKGNLLIKFPLTALENDTAEQRKAKLLWLSDVIVKALQAMGAREAAEHLQYWLKQEGERPKIPIEMLQSTAEYKNFKRFLSKACADGRKTGKPYEGTTLTRNYKVYLLM